MASPIEIHRAGAEHWEAYPGPGLSPHKIAYDKKEAAQAVGVSVRTIEREIARGALTAKRVGSKVIVTNDDISEWLSGLPDAVQQSTGRTSRDTADTEKAREVAQAVVSGVPRKRGRPRKNPNGAA